MLIVVTFQKGTLIGYLYVTITCTMSPGCLHGVLSARPSGQSSRLYWPSKRRSHNEIVRIQSRIRQAFTKD